MKNMIFYILLLILCSNINGQLSEKHKYKPVIYGEWWQITSNPDLGELYSAKQQPVDFTDEGYFVTQLPVAAPELVIYMGQWYIFALNPELDGIHVVRLKLQSE